MQFKRLPFITVYVILFITLSSPIFSQSISGKVIDAKAEVLPYANILLLNALDSSLVKGELSDEQGNFRFEVSSNQAYLISASYVGYIDFFSEAILSNEEEDHNLNDIILSEGVSLDEIQIVAKKPLFEQKIDRLVVNVASSVTSAGGTALEVLEKSPGVNVNRQSGALSLIGKQGVVIMINGKVTYQPAESIV